MPENPYFYIGLKGGLGNQMFQYAFGVAASLETHHPLALDLTNYGMQSAIDTPRSFLLQHFNIQAHIADTKHVAKFHARNATLFRKIKRKLFPRSEYMYNAHALKVKQGQYLEGFWQTEKYFLKYSDTIKSELSLKNPYGAEALAAHMEIKQAKEKGFETIMVHIRRGDYVTNPHSVKLLGVLSPEYFNDAIAKIVHVLDVKSMNDHGTAKPKHIFFASEDVAWVKEHIKPHHDFTFISRPGIYDFEEIMLMSECDHFVISNSSFSWWAAWLGKNPNKQVVAPKRWIMDPKVRTDDATPASWLRI